eukprot:SAG31_NODE_2650_length_5298_cov_1.690710_1_plen_228_part_00
MWLVPLMAANILLRSAAAAAAAVGSGGGGGAGYGGLGAQPVPCGTGSQKLAVRRREAEQQLQAPCPLKPCPVHKGRWYCPSDKTPGQCDSPANRTSACPACPGRPNVPPGPPLPAPIPGPPCAGGFNTTNDGMCPGPNYHGCLNATARALPYCNTSLPVEQRIESLIGMMHLQQQIQMIGPTLSWGFSPCACFTPTPLPRSQNVRAVCCFLVSVPTIREIRDFYPEM